jgi:EmrB/QacA subfamily drug resistance transporter
MLGLGLGVFMATLDSSIVNISLPTLVKELNTNFATIEWVILAYVLVLTSLMIGVARLGDMLDKKRLYTSGLVIFTISSLLCGMAPDVGWLIAFRALQGIGAAMTQALGIAIISEIFPTTERGRALGIMGTIVSTGIAVGPPLGGILIGTIGWRSIFLVNVPVGILAVLVVMRFVPSSITRPGQRFDLFGAILLFITLSLYALGMTMGQQEGFDNQLTGILLIGALLGLVVFLVYESRVKQPMVDLSMFRNSLFSINLLMGFLVFVVTAGFFILPFFLQLVKGYETQKVGLLMMTNPIVTGLIAPIAGSLSDRYGSRVISLVGLVLVVAGCLTLSTLHTGVNELGFILRYLPIAMGFGMFQSPNNNAIMSSAPRDRMGVAGGLLSLSRTLGMTTGLPLMGALFSALVLATAGLPAGTDATLASGDALVAGINGTYRIAAVIVFISTLLAFTALQIDNRRKREAQVSNKPA